MSNTYSIIHLSDLHYSVPKLKIADLHNKRTIGVINERFIKKSYGRDQQRERLLKNIAEKEWDLLCITGDFSNLSYEKEFQKAKSQLELYFGGREIVVLAGNHDRYIKKAAREELFEQYFKEYIIFNWSKKKEYSIHTKTILDKFLLVFFDMSVPRPWFSSRGSLSPNFFKEYQQKIRTPENKHKEKIGFGHYPLFIPDGKREKFWRKLTQAKKLASFLLEDSFLAYCHGHIHYSWQEIVETRGNSIWSLNSGGGVLSRQKRSQFYNHLMLHSNGKILVRPLFY